MWSILHMTPMSIVAVVASRTGKIIQGYTLLTLPKPFLKRRIFAYVSFNCKTRLMVINST